MKKYRVSVSYLFDAVDDVAAREHIKFLELDSDATIKLQEIYVAKEPRNVIIPRRDRKPGG